jgi:hypothetical protein
MIPMYAYILMSIIVLGWGIIFSAYCVISVKFKKHKKSKIIKSDISKVDTKKTSK